MNKCFIDPSAVIGENTRIWHFAVVLAGVKIGANCSIGSGAEVGRGTAIGDRSRISHGVFLPSDSVIGCDVFIGPCVVFTDDRYPRANHSAYTAEPPIVEDGASIGAGAVILPGVRIGRGAMIGAGAVITKNVAANTTLRGEPSRTLGLPSL